MGDNRWIERRVFHWAHRGGGRENPSNTLRAMRYAMSVGAHGLELDVHATADEPPVVVVAHDDELEKMTGAPGRIRSTTLRELRLLDAGHNWVPGKIAASTLGPGETFALRGLGPRDPDLRIPTLEEVLDAFPGVPINIELKSPKVAEPLAEVLLRRDRTDVIVGSFFDWRVRRFRRRAPGLPTSAGGMQLALFWLASRLGLALPLRRVVALQSPWRLGPKRMSDARFVRAAHRRGIAVHVWTVDDGDAMRRAIDVGVDGIMTDCPSVLSRVLSERDAGWR